MSACFEASDNASSEPRRPAMPKTRRGLPFDGLGQEDDRESGAPGLQAVQVREIRPEHARGGRRDKAAAGEREHPFGRPTAFGVRRSIR